jgi:hypothetical protein
VSPFNLLNGYGFDPLQSGRKPCWGLSSSLFEIRRNNPMNLC